MNDDESDAILLLDIVRRRGLQAITMLASAFSVVGEQVADGEPSPIAGADASDFDAAAAALLATNLSWPNVG